MLEIRIEGLEYYDEAKDLFIDIPSATIVLEHSLISISKWESKWHKPYLSKERKSIQELVDYIRCMTLTQNVNPMLYNNLSEKNLKDIFDYIEDPMTATTINERSVPRGGRSEIYTSEVIYYWMVAHNIPFECQKWHINRLLTLIRICNIKNQDPSKNKRSPREVMEERRALNAKRRAELNSKG